MKFIKSKEFVYILLIILITIAAVILLFFPKAIEYKYPYYYENLVTKKTQVELTNSNLYENERRIDSSIGQLQDVKVERERVEEKTLEVRKGIKESDFELKISSILISLEQRAYENNANLIIGYSSILYVNGGSGGIQEQGFNPGDNLSKPGGPAIPGGKDTINPPNGEENPKSEPDDLDDLENLEKGPIGGSDIKIESKPDKSDKPDTGLDQINSPVETTAEELPAFSEERLQQGTINIPGIDVLVIPIVVDGSYYNVRNYIKYLDTIGMIEPSSLVIQSTGKVVHAEIILNVFHGEVGL